MELKARLLFSSQHTIRYTRGYASFVIHALHTDQQLMSLVNVIKSEPNSALLKLQSQVNFVQLLSFPCRVVGLGTSR